MIAHIKGKVTEQYIDKDFLKTVIDVGGVGYELLLTMGSQFKFSVGEVVLVYVCESVTAFDGATTLYGFLSKEEKDLFTRLRENVDGMGPKKALECLDKISKSLPDFKRALIDEDSKLLVSVFGFTKKTAEKLIFSLKGKVDSWGISGQPKWPETEQTSQSSEALLGLMSLGYSNEEARELLAQAVKELGNEAKSETLIKQALKNLGMKKS
ncbi:MAG: Holliday junction branch migration protein RuvA [Elusimicrobiota bacterium]